MVLAKLVSSQTIAGLVVNNAGDFQFSQSQKQCAETQRKLFKPACGMQDRSTTTEVAAHAVVGAELDRICEITTQATKSDVGPRFSGTEVILPFSK